MRPGAISRGAGSMLRHFADFGRSLAELRDSGRVELTEEETSIEPITGLLLGG